MHVLAGDSLRNESERVSDCERDIVERRELVGDLGRRVAGADNDHPQARVGDRVAVVGDVEEPAGEAWPGPTAVGQAAGRGNPVPAGRLGAGGQNR